MTYKTMLDKVLEVLSRKGIKVQFVDSEKDGIEVAELKNKVITINVNSRNQLSILFTIAHLFGHFNQFRNYDQYRDLVETVEKPKPLQLTDDFKRRFFEYEKEAYGIGKSLMLDAFPVSDELDSKYQTFMHTDFEHFWNYVTSNTNESISEFNKLLDENYSKNIRYEKQIEPITVTEFSEGEVVNAEVTVF